MMQRWGEDALRFMCDASEYGSFYKTLAEELLPYLPRDGHICDAGCGLGYLSQTLAEHCAHVTAIDIAQAPIDSLASRCTEDHLHIRCENIFDISDTFDAMIFCYFGKTEEILNLAKKLCSGQVIVIKRDCSEHTFSLGQVRRKRHSVENIRQALRDRGIPFVQKQLCIEMGQPFRCLEDAMRFFELYNKSDQAVTLDLVEKRLIRTESREFPLYLPSIRKMEMIVFSTTDL